MIWCFLMMIQKSINGNFETLLIVSNYLQPSWIINKPNNCVWLGFIYTSYKGDSSIKQIFIVSTAGAHGMSSIKTLFNHVDKFLGSILFPFFQLKNWDLFFKLVGVKTLLQCELVNISLNLRHDPLPQLLQFLICINDYFQYYNSKLKFVIDQRIIILPSLSLVALYRRIYAMRYYFKTPYNL